MNSAQPVPPKLSAPLGHSTGATPLMDREWRRVRLRAQQLELALPEAPAWRVSARDSWWRVTHERAQSELEVKAWNQGTLVDARDCELQARLWKPALPQARATQVIAHEVQTRVAGYVSEVWVLAEAAPGTAEAQVMLSLLVFGGELRSCLALHFRTQGSGANASSVLSESVALVREKLLPTVRRLQITDKVRPLAR